MAIYRRIQQSPRRSSATGAKTNPLNVNRPTSEKKQVEQRAEKEASSFIIRRSQQRRADKIYAFSNQMAKDPSLAHIESYSDFLKWARVHPYPQSIRSQVWESLVAYRLGHGEHIDQRRPAVDPFATETTATTSQSTNTASAENSQPPTNPSSPQSSVTVAERPQTTPQVAQPVQTDQNNQIIAAPAGNSAPTSIATKETIPVATNEPLIVPTARSTTQPSISTTQTSTAQEATTPNIQQPNTTSSSLTNQSVVSSPIAAPVVLQQPAMLQTSRPLNIPFSSEPTIPATPQSKTQSDRELKSNQIKKASAISKPEQTQAPKITKVSVSQRIAGTPINIITTGIKQEKSRQQTANTFEKQREAVKNTYINQVKEKPKLAVDAAQWQQIAARAPEFRGITDAKTFEEKRKELNLQGRNISENAWQYFQASLALPQMNQTESQMQQEIDAINKKQAEETNINTPTNTSHLPHAANTNEQKIDKKQPEKKPDVDNTAKPRPQQEQVSTPYFQTTVMGNGGKESAAPTTSLPTTTVAAVVAAPVVLDQVALQNRDRLIDNQVYAARMQAQANGKPWTMTDALTLREQLKSKFAANPASLTKTTATSLGGKTATATFVKTGIQPITRLAGFIRGTRANLTTPRNKQSFTYSKSPIFSRVINKPFTSSHFNYISNNAGASSAPPHSPKSSPQTTHPSSRPPQQRRAGSNPAVKVAKAVSVLIRWWWLFVPGLIALVIIFFTVFIILILGRGNGTATTTGTATNSTAVTIIKSGPKSIDNGNTITYTLTVTAPNAADEIDVSDPILFDITGDPTDVTPSDGTYDAASKTLSWKFMNTPASFSQTISFTVQPTATNTQVYNIANATITGAQGPGGGSTDGTDFGGNVAANSDNCAGKIDPPYTLATINGSPIPGANKNFGDPGCNFNKSDLYSLIKTDDTGSTDGVANVDLWYYVIIGGESAGSFPGNGTGGESSYNPNSYASPEDPVQAALDNSGAWGLFQMSGKEQNGPLDNGKVNWPIQVSNAISYNKNQDNSFCYWSTARVSGFADLSSSFCQ